MRLRHRRVTPYEIAGQCRAKLPKISTPGMATGPQLLLSRRQQALQLEIAYPEMQHQRRSTPNSIFFFTAPLQHSVVEAHHDGVTGAAGVQSDLGSLGNNVDIARHESAKLLTARAANFDSGGTGQLHDHVVDLNLALTNERLGLRSALDRDAIHLQTADRLRSEHGNTPLLLAGSCVPGWTTWGEIVEPGSCPNS